MPTVVSDGRTILTGVDAAGDEPLMLARALLGKAVSVVVCADRYAAGRLAETRLGATVHVLDDGFQHLALARDVDLLVTGEHDLADRAAAAWTAARAAVCSCDTPTRFSLTPDIRTPPNASPGRCACATRITSRARCFAPRIVGTGDTVVVPNDSRVFAFAGIARPERFFSDLTSAGWNVVGTKSFRDHHYFSRSEVETHRHSGDEGARGDRADDRQGRGRLCLSTRSIPHPIARSPPSRSCRLSNRPTSFGRGCWGRSG